MRGDEVVSVRGDADDVFSRGFLCPKSQGLKQLHEDPDRLSARWFAATASSSRRAGTKPSRPSTKGSGACSPTGDRNAVAVYIGNPAPTASGRPFTAPALLKALGTRNIFSASTVDQMPKQVAGGLMFGTGLSVAVPDVDRTDHLLMLGANPLVSNGSLLTAPDMRGRIRAIRERGGKVVVVDPRRSRTAKEADEHHFIRPGTDAHLLFAIVNVLIAEGLADSGPPRRAGQWRRGDRAVGAAVHPRGRRAGLRDRRRRRSAGWQPSSPAPSAPPSTGASGRRHSASARSRAGSSTSSTTSPATSTARAARCSRSPLPPSATPPGTGRRAGA